MLLNCSTTTCSTVYKQFLELRECWLFLYVFGLVTDNIFADIDTYCVEKSNLWQFSTET